MVKEKPKTSSRQTSHYDWRLYIDYLGVVAYNKDFISANKDLSKLNNEVLLIENEIDNINTSIGTHGHVEPWIYRLKTSEKEIVALQIRVARQNVLIEEVTERISFSLKLLFEHWDHLIYDFENDYLDRDAFLKYLALLKEIVVDGVEPNLLSTYPVVKQIREAIKQHLPETKLAIK